MEVKGRFDHFNINVLDLEKSIAFYNKALGLKEHHRKVAEDGSFILVYLTDEQTGFLMELTWLRDRKEPYELGDNGCPSSSGSPACITDSDPSSNSPISPTRCALVS